MSKYSKTTNLILCALFAALTAVFSWIAIPLPFTPVPVVLATMATCLAGSLLGPRYGSFSMIVYVLLGAAGIPVFHSFTGGLGILAGPTGGYIIGYIISALICGLLLDVLAKKKLTWWSMAVSMTAGLTGCYVLGTLWFIISTGNSLGAALVMCVLPFLPGEILKIFASMMLVKKLRPRLLKK